MVDRTARYVAKDGTAFEQRLLDREAGNPDFGFLFEYESKEGQYYRWKVRSPRHGAVPCGTMRAVLPHSLSKTRNTASHKEPSSRPCLGMRDKNIIVVQIILL